MDIFFPITPIRDTKQINTIQLKVHRPQSSRPSTSTLAWPKTNHHTRITEAVQCPAAGLVSTAATAAVTTAVAAHRAPQKLDAVLLRCCGPHHRAVVASQSPCCCDGRSRCHIRGIKCYVRAEYQHHQFINHLKKIIIFYFR